MQAQGHVQMVLHAVDRGDDPQTALGRPRWFWDPGTGRVHVEAAAPDEVVTRLRGLGHDVDVASSTAVFGRGQAIWRLDADDAGSVLVAGSEPRADGYPMGW